MAKYVKLSIGFIELPQSLNPELYNNIGKSLEDYREDKYIELTELLWQFHLDHLNADVDEILNTKLKIKSEQEILLEVKDLIIMQILEYSDSKNVNDFVINNTVHGWLTPLERSNYLQSITSAELLNETMVDFFVNNYKFSLSINTAKIMLAKILRYADNAYIVAKEKIILVNNLNSIEALKSFNISDGFPEKLNFLIEV